MAENPGLKAAQEKLDQKRRELYNVMQEGKASGKGSIDLDAIKSVSGSNDDKLAWIRTRNEELTPLKADVEKYKSLGEAAANVEGFGVENKGDGSGVENKGDKGQLDAAASFVKSEAFKNKGAKSHLDVDVKTLFQTGRASGAGWAPEVTRSGYVGLIPMVAAPSVTDHLPTQPISQIAYKFMQEVTYTNGASNIAEGGPFQQAALALQEVSQPVEKVGVWLPMTDEQLEDEAGAEAYVRARLTNMINQRVDVQALQGDGNTNNLLGTVNVSGIQTGTASRTAAVGADNTIVDAAYQLFTDIRTIGFAEPSVSFARADVWQPVQLLKTADGIYVWGHPSAAPGTTTLWGVPVVVTQAAPANTFVAGDYARYGFLGVKRGLDVQVTNTHDTDFINGKQAIRMDTRLVMVHLRPSAFGVLSITA